MLKSYEPQGGAGEADGEIPLPEDDALNPLAKKAAAVTPLTGVPGVPPLPGVQAAPIGAMGGGHGDLGNPRTSEMDAAVPFAGGVQSFGTMNAMTPGAPPPSPVPAAAPPPPVAAPSPIETLSGAWTPPVASTQSTPLIASAAGGTMTPQGTAQNPFLGLETDQGGKSGGYDTVPLANDPSGRTFKQYDQDFVKNANALKQVPPLSPAEFQAMRATDDGANAVKDKIAKGQPVTDKELAYVRQARAMELGQDTAAPTFGTFGTKTGTATAADPAEQERLLAGMAAGSIPSGPSSGGAAPALPSAAPAPLPAPSSPGAPPAAPTPPGLPGPAPAPSSGAPLGTPKPAYNVAPSSAPTLTPTDPNNPLTNQTIDYGPLADRFKVAQSELDNWNKTSDPQFQADLRAAMQKAAAGGALGSGMLQTGLGDIALSRETQRQGMGTSFLNNALTGTIQDAKDRTSLAERQQGFQAGQQGTAFNQGVTEAQLEDQLTGNQFQRELQKLIAGSSGNPADTQLALSGIFGNAGADASNALSGLIKGKTANGASDASSGNYFAELLKQLLGGGGGDTTMTPAATTVYGGQ